MNRSSLNKAWKGLVKHFPDLDPHDAQERFRARHDDGSRTVFDDDSVQVPEGGSLLAHFLIAVAEEFRVLHIDHIDGPHR